MTAAPENAFVFNIVWTGTVFPYLRPFVASQLAHSDARFRFVLNACAAEQVPLIEQFAAHHPDQVVEILDVSADRMVAHGEALERVRASRDDGEYFCLIDSDIRASGPFVADFSTILSGGAAGVTAGRSIWAETNVIPDGHIGVNGEYFYSADGFLFGSPHFAMYRRAAIDEVAERWGVGFASAGPDLSDDAKARLEAAGQSYWLYDTGKLVNAFLQLAGHRLIHEEHPHLLHVGGMSHYLSPPDRATTEGREQNPEWATWDPDRLEVAQLCAAVLVEVAAGRPAPEVPAGLDDRMANSLSEVRRELIELVARFPD